MALTTSNGIIVTGDGLLDKKLAELPRKLQNKYIRKAVREVGKKVRGEIVSTAPRDTGAMAAAMQIRAVGKTIKKGTGIFKSAISKSGFEYNFEVQRAVGRDIGIKVEITRESLAKQLMKRGLADKARRVLNNDMGFYPAFVELGTSRRGPQSSMRAAIRRAQSWAIRAFRVHLLAFISDASK